MTIAELIERLEKCRKKLGDDVPVAVMGDDMLNAAVTVLWGLYDVEPAWAIPVNNNFLNVVGNPGDPVVILFQNHQ